MSGNRPTLSGEVYSRSPNDFYTEPKWAVEALFNAVRFVGPIHDGACGGGNIPTVARDMGIGGTGADVVDRGFGEVGVDFLKDDRSWSNIVTNPPFQLCEQFIRHALQVAEHKVAVLVRLAFLEGQDRRERLFVPHPPARVLVFSRRVSMPPGGMSIKAEGGKTAYAWIIWSADWDGPTQLGWIK
jgi:hypothetical protein